MRHSLYLAAAAATLPIAVATPASAGLEIFIDINGVIDAVSDNAAGDTNSAVGTIQLAPTTINGVLIEGELASSTSPGPPNFLNNSVLNVINTTGVAKTVEVVVSDTGFTGPVTGFAAAGSGTWQNSIGSSLTFNWFIDPANGQGAGVTGATPGTKVSTFTSPTATDVIESFSNGVASGSFAAAGPFSMTLQSEYDLQPFGQLVNRGIDLDAAVPEASTWVMMLLGFAGLGFAGYRSSRTKISIAD
jgi:hypothetical protein